jgi:cytochrome c-type biogenesis protein CcmH
MRTGKTTINSSIFWIFILLSMIFLPDSRVSAQDDSPPQPSDNQVNAIAKQMYCPVCENTPLDVCPTQACEEWRGLIRDKLALGWNEEQIKTYFVEQYGDRVLASPPAQGFNWLVYLMPPLGFIAGIFLIYKAFTTYRKPVQKTVDQWEKPLESDPYVQRLEEELQNFQESP